MNKKSIITALFDLVALVGQAQEINMNEPSFNDYLPLLNAKGYMAYSFDTQDFSGKMAEPIVKEYVSGKEVGNLIDFDISISLGKKLIVGFSPSENDSTANYIFQFAGGAFNESLMLHPIFNPSEPTIPFTPMSRDLLTHLTNRGWPVHSPLLVWFTDWWSTG